MRSVQASRIAAPKRSLNRCTKGLSSGSGFGGASLGGAGGFGGAAAPAAAPEGAAGFAGVGGAPEAAPPAAAGAADFAAGGCAAGATGSPMGFSAFSLADFSPGGLTGGCFSSGSLGIFPRLRQTAGGGVSSRRTQFQQPLHETIFSNTCGTTAQRIPPHFSRSQRRSARFSGPNL